MRAVSLFAALLVAAIVLSGCFFQTDLGKNGPSDELPGIGSGAQLQYFEPDKRQWADFAYLFPHREEGSSYYLFAEQQSATDKAILDMQAGDFGMVSAYRLADERFLFHYTESRSGELKEDFVAFVTLKDGIYHVLQSIESLDMLKEIMNSVPEIKNDPTTDFFAPIPYDPAERPERLVVANDYEAQRISQFFSANLPRFNQREKVVMRIKPN